jgi:hypothetical protein
MRHGVTGLYALTRVEVFQFHGDANARGAAARKRSAGTGCCPSPVMCLVMFIKPRCRVGGTLVFDPDGTTGSTGNGGDSDASLHVVMSTISGSA